MAPQPSPQNWTLRFKNHRSTILLHVDPLQPLHSVKAELLKALQQTQPSGKLNDVPIPQNSSDILLARLRDINDRSAGWESIEPEKGTFDVEVSGKGKGKASVPSSTGGRKSDAAKNALLDCVQGAGLRDGGILAFKFRSEEIGKNMEYERVDVKDDEIRIEDEEDEEWDVVEPAWDEGYDDVMDRDG